jgi:hypothetical protein
MVITNEQILAIKKGDAVRFSEEGTELVLVRADLFDRLQEIRYDDGPWTDDEMDLLAAEDADRLGWDGMEAYQERSE